ncbi:hypothetical protein [Acidianus brierleyi]|nr:hypothetical protein [Acidianus brierleyi]
MLEFLAATYAPPSSISFEDIFGFGLAGVGILGGILYYLLIRKKAI